MKDQHVILGKWVDCKSAIPISEMKNIQKNKEEDEGYQNVDDPI